MSRHMHRAYNSKLKVEVGRPVYYTVDDEMRLGRVVRIVGENATVVRDGKREQIPVDRMTVAKRARKEMCDGYVG